MRTLLALILIAASAVSDIQGFVILKPRTTRTTFAFLFENRILLTESTTSTLRSTPTNTIEDEEPITYNCHIHLCHLDHVPPRFPNRFIRSLANIGFIRKAVSRMLRIAIPFTDDDNLERMADFIDHGGLDEEALFEIVVGHYPTKPPTRFVVLPMDLRGLYKGQPEVNVIQQHRDLAKLAKGAQGRIIPFVHIDPRSGNKSEMDGPNALDFIKNCTTIGLEGVVFQGIKLYPPLGYNPDDGPNGPVDKIFAYASEHNLPVTVHCNKGGIHTDLIMKDGAIKKLSKTEKAALVNYAAPSNYKKALKKHKNMRLNLAHFGGNGEWDVYLRNRATLETDPNWVDDIAAMMKSGDYPNLYTDISYTMHRHEEYVEELKELLTDDRIRSHVLFGSDYYMSEQENFPEEKINDALRNKLTDTVWWQIAHDNPRKFLNID